MLYFIERSIDVNFEQENEITVKFDWSQIKYTYISFSIHTVLLLLYTEAIGKMSEQ